MEHLYKYNQFINEGFLGFGGSSKGDIIFKEMVKDYKDSGENVKKAKIYGDCMTYVFGDTPYNMGNRKVGDKEVKINSVNNTGAFIEVIKWVVNPDHDPNYRGRPLTFDWAEGGMPIPNFPQHNQEEKNRLRIYNEEEEEIRVSRTFARKIINFFRNEYDRKYPQQKLSKNKNYMTIQEIERGEKPTLGFVSAMAMNGVECTFTLTDLEDKPKYEWWIKHSYGIKGKSKEGYPVTYCYKPEFQEIDKEIDPYGEEDWNTKEEEIKEWIANSTREEIKEQIRKDIEQQKSGVGGFLNLRTFTRDDEEPKPEPIKPVRGML